MRGRILFTRSGYGGRPVETRWTLDTPGFVSKALHNFLFLVSLSRRHHGRRWYFPQLFRVGSSLVGGDSLRLAGTRKASSRVALYFQTRITDTKYFTLLYQE